MITEDAVLNFALNPSGYLSGAQQVSAATQTLQANLSNVLVTTSLLRGSLDALTPKRAMMVGWAGFASEAAKSDEVLQQMTANSTVTNINVGKLHRTINTMAREMPVGINNSRAVVTQFSQMGVASEGTEKKVGALSKTIFQLSGATGDGPQQLAAGMVELSRVTGNRNLDPRRFSALSDSLTTVSKTSGAGAANVLQFSQAIAPIATSAGIGSTAILGISSAFSSLGQDGFGAANAVNRMLMDMSKAARDGGEQMGVYAEITGKTRKEFEELFKSNPTEAIVQVTEAIGKAGPRGGRMLESLGLDSIRTMPALTALSSSGQLRSTVATAVGAYGSGSTTRASEAAFEGFYDQLSKTGESARQLGEALGTPILGPLETFAKALQGPIDVLAKIAENPAFQGVARAATVGGMGASMFSRVLGPLGALALGRQALTSGPIASLVAGMSRGRGDAPDATRMARFGRRATDYYDNDGFRGPTAGANRWLFGFGRSVAEGREQSLQERMSPEQYARRQERMRTGQGPRGQGPGLVGRTIGGFAMMGTVYGDMLRAQMNDAMEPDFNRRDSGMGHYRTRAESRERAREAGERVRMFGGTSRDVREAERDAFRRDRQRTTSSPETVQAWDRARASFRDRRDDGAGGLRASTGAIRDFNASLRGSITTQQQFNQAVIANGRAMMATARYGAMEVGNVGRGAGRVMGGIASSALGLVGGVGGAAMIGGFALYDSYQRKKAEAEEDARAFSERDINTTLNRYRESSGRATIQGGAHGSLGANLGAHLTSGAQTISSAIKVSQADLAAASGSKADVVRRYQGTPDQVAAQIASMSPGAMSPQDLQGVKVDLLRQGYTESQVNDIMGQVSGSMGTTGAAAPVNRQEMLSTALSGPLEAPGTGHTNWGSKLAMAPAMMFPGLLKTGLPQGAARAVHADELTPEVRESLKAISDSVAAQYQAQIDDYGTAYAEQERLAGAEALLKQAEGTAAYGQLSRELTSGITGKQGGYVVSQSKIQDAGGFGEALAVLDKNYQADLDRLREEQAKSGGALEPVRIQSEISKLIGQESDFFGHLFDARSGADANRAITGFMEAPDSVSALDKAVTETLSTMTSGVTSLQGRTQEMLDVMNAVPVESDSYRLMAEVQARGEFAMRTQQRGMAPSQQMAEQHTYLTSLATQDAQNEAQAQQKSQAQQSLAGLEDQMVSRLQSRLTAQREYEVAVDRSNEDFTQSKWYAMQDYGRSRERVVYQAEKQEGRAREDFGIQTAQAYQDYFTSVQRAQRDFATQYERTMEDYQRNVERQTEAFHTSMIRAEEDYQSARARAVRDFGISMQRAEEDYQTGRARMAQDYQKQTRRATADFNKQMARGEADYQVQRQRSIADFNLSMQRGQEDFRLQMARAEEDFNTARLRTQADFDKSMARQAEDAAKSIYSPYQRIQTQATWDARNLLVNLQEQNSAIAKQKDQLDQARSMGLSQDVIDQLDLGNAANAQQLDQLLRDMQMDPALIEQFNRMIQERMGAGKDLFEDESNVGRRRAVEDFLEQQARAYDDHLKGMDRAQEDFYKGVERANEDFFKGLERAREDFMKANKRANEDFMESMRRGWEDYRETLKRGEEDYAKSTQRSRADFARSLEDMAADHSKMVTRAGEDFRRGLRHMEQDLKTSLERTSKDFAQAMQDNAADFSRTMSRSRDSFNRSMDRMAEDLADSLEDMDEDFSRSMIRMDNAHERSLKRMAADLKRTDEVIAGDFRTLHEQTQKALSGQSVDWQKIVVNDSEKLVKEIERKVLPEYEKVMSEMGIDPKYFEGSYGGGGSRRSGGGGGRQALADGGLVEGFSPHSKADNIPIDSTAGEFMQPVSTVNYYGLDAMEGLRTRSIPREALTGDGDDPPRPMTFLDVDKLLSGLDQDKKGIYGGGREGTRDAMDKAYGVGLDADFGGGGGNFAGQGMPWRAIWSLIKQVAPEAYMTSNYRPGAITASGFVSYHGRDGGRAVDLASSNMASTFNKIRPLLPWSELYYSPMDFLQLRNGRPHRPTGVTRRNHFDHIHAAYDEGGWLEPGEGHYLNATGKPEPVLTHGQWEDLSEMVDSVGRMVTNDDARSLRAAQGAPMVIHNNQSYVYDNRNDFGDAQITVVAQDPDEMASRLDERSRQQRLSQTRGVNR